MKNRSLKDYTGQFKSTERRLASSKMPLPFAKDMSKPKILPVKKKSYPRTYTEAQAKAMAMDYTLKLIEGLRAIRNNGGKNDCKEKVDKA